MNAQVSPQTIACTHVKMRNAKSEIDPIFRSALMAYGGYFRLINDDGASILQCHIFKRDIQMAFSKSSSAASINTTPFTLWAAAEFIEL